MVLRFRKSISLGKGMRLNIGKTGLGFSVGVKGLRFGIGSKGVYASAGIPGTGLYSINYMGKGSKPSGGGVANSKGGLKGCLLFLVAIAGIVLLVSVPKVGLALLAIVGIAYCFWARQPKQRAKRKLAKARKFLNQHNYEQAIRLLTEAHEIEGANDEITRLLAMVLHDCERFDEAINLLKNILERNPGDIDSRLVLASCFYRAGRYSDAIAILQKLPEELQRDLKVIRMLGACFLALKEYDLAINVFKRAPLRKQNLDEDLMEIHYNLAIAYEGLGDKEKALKHLKQVHAQDIGYRDVSERIEELEEKG